MQTKKDNFDFTKRNRIVTILALICIACVFFLYLSTTKVMIDEYAKYTLKNQLQMATVSITAKLNDAKRSIAAASGDVAAGWREDDDFDVVSHVDSIKENYVFDILEFVDTEGYNLMSGSNRFNASDREYFKEGIKGHTGLWINYTPKESKEFLLDFYSPVFYNGEIVGILVGALGSKKTIEPLTKANYFGHESIGVLYNEDERAIAASFGVSDEIYAPDIYDMFNLTDNDKQIFSEHVKSKDENVFSYEGEKGEGIACASRIEEYGWGLVIIIPSSTFSSVYSDFTSTGIMTLGAITIIVSIYILYTLGINRHRFSMQLQEEHDILTGFSKVYNSVFVLDYNTNTARCLRLRDPSASKYGITEGENVPLKESFIKYLMDSANINGEEVISPLKNIMYIKTILSDKDFFILEYSLKAGGNGHIAIADISPNAESTVDFDNERYLLGITNLD